MPVRRLAAVAALCLLVVLAAAGAFYVTAPSPPVAQVTDQGPAKPETWSTRMVDCANGVMTYPVLNSPEVQDCLKRVMFDAVDAGQFEALAVGLEQQIEKTHALFDTCHNVGHLAGQYAFEKTGDAAALLRRNPNTTCVYALGHGILDGFAKSNPAPEEYATVARACVDMVDSVVSAHAALCADGLGHAAWEATKDVARAVDLCMLVPSDQGRLSCGGGIVMQIFEPAGAEPKPDDPVVPAGLVEMCASWDAADRALKAGCADGAGYMFTRPAWRLQAAWRSEHLDTAPDAQTTEQLRDLMGQAYQGCTLIADERDQCFESVAAQVPQVVYLDEQVKNRVCSALDAHAERCRTWVHSDW